MPTSIMIAPSPRAWTIRRGPAGWRGRRCSSGRRASALACPRCGGEIGPVAVTLDPAVPEKTIGRLDLATRAPPPRRYAPRSWPLPPTSRSVSDGGIPWRRGSCRAAGGRLQLTSGASWSADSITTWRPSGSYAARGARVWSSAPRPDIVGVMKQRRPAARPVVFLGPSTPLEAARAILDADYRRPVRRGDLERLPPGQIVGIIDGEFGA